LQWERFAALAHEVFPADPFFKKKWSAAGIRSADDLRSWDDFSKLPLTVKSELVADQAEHPPFGSNLTYPLERYVRVHQTSGTTGAPIRWLDTQASWDWWARCWGFVLRGAGVTPEDRAFFSFSFALFIGFWAGFEGARQLGAMVIPAGGVDSPTRLHLIENLSATVLVCTPSYALHLIDVAKERGIDLAKLPVRIMVQSGEPGAGIPATRRRLETGWGARCYDHAGMSEVGAYGFECVTQAGLHVNESEFIAEVIDPVTGKPAQEGELILTNLGRHGSPIFRYRSGDRVRLGQERCACGRSFVRLEGGILARMDDMLIVRGVNVFPSALEGIIRQFEAVDEFQIEVFKQKEMHEVRLLLEVDSGRHGPSVVGETVRAVIERVRIEIGIRVEAEAVPPGRLPRFELKAKRVVRRQA
ncbi:MAG TPA: phenylacetate--CoA ligase family protein, partial [Methylomirabilota bacterium]|nr:phenylacetate--CoA ligase family protein [Methylomirabilota bacterium]